MRHRLTIDERLFIGGHPEWDLGTRIIGRDGNVQTVYDVAKQRIVGTLGTPEMFPDPEGDIALSPDGNWFVNGYRVQNANYYAILNRQTGDFVRTKGFNCKGWTSGDLRLDLHDAVVGSAEVTGSTVFKTWVLPFEVLSVLLLAALVGAIALSRPVGSGEQGGR